MAIGWWSLLSDPIFLEHAYSELCRLQQLVPVHHDRQGVHFILGHRVPIAMSEWRLQSGVTALSFEGRAVARPNVGDAA